MVGDTYTAARAAFVEATVGIEAMVAALPAGALGAGDWRRVRFSNTNPPGGFSTVTTDRHIDAKTWGPGQESAETIDAALADWHRNCSTCTSHGTGSRRASTQRQRARRRAGVLRLRGAVGAGRGRAEAPALRAGAAAVAGSALGNAAARREGCVDTELRDL